MKLNINDSQILWPGKLKRKPEGIIIPTHLKVLTIEEKPFIYVRRLEVDEAACDPEEEIPCPLFNATDGTGKFNLPILRPPHPQFIIVDYRPTKHHKRTSIRPPPWAMVQ